MEMTNEQKHEMFKREISASIIESASWNDRQMEEYKTITMYEFWYDYIDDGFLYDCMDANKDFLMGKANEFEEDFNLMRDTLWYGGIIKMVYEDNAKLDMHDCYDFLTEEVTEYCIECENEVDLKLLNEAIVKLEPREKYIMELRFGFVTGEEKTQKDVADMLNISQSYISRLEKKIIKRLKKDITAKI
jgi:RNA polymerase sigma factor (sigma-70 family)